MRIPAFPDWLSWLLLLAVIWLYIQVYLMLPRVGAGRAAPRSRQELEAGYTAGQISRDEYERWKSRLT